jgi:hypothetical protein
MHIGRKSKRDFDDEWKDNTNDFLEFAWANSRGHFLVWCPCTKCDNKRRVSKEDLPKTIVGDSPRGPLKKPGNPHLKPATSQNQMCIA